MKEQFRKYCEDEAIRWRHTLGLFAYDPLPAEALAKHLNIPIWGQEEILKYGKDLYEMLRKEEKSSWSGSVIVLPGGKHLILVNPSHAPSRLQSTIMHELAHILLNHQPLHIGGILIREYSKENEEQAAYLGGCLQIPRKALQWAYQSQMTREQIAYRFGASLEMVRWRCNDTGFAEKIL
jgi:hypothetical protein